MKPTSTMNTTRIASLSFRLLVTVVLCFIAFIQLPNAQAQQQSQPNPIVAKCPFIWFDPEAAVENAEKTNPVNPDLEYQLYDGAANASIQISKEADWRTIAGVRKDIYANVSAKLVIKDTTGAEVYSKVIDGTSSWVGEGGTAAEPDRYKLTIGDAPADTMNSPYAMQLTLINLNNSADVSSESPQACSDSPEISYGCGCSSCTNGCEDEEPKTGSVYYKMAVGAGENVDSATFLIYRLDNTQNKGPSSLKVAPAPGFQINRDANTNNITSVVSGTVQAVVSSISSPSDPFAFKVEFKHRVGISSGQIFKTVTFENKEVLGEAVLRVGVTKNEITKYYDFFQSEDPNGVYNEVIRMMSAGGMRRETRMKGNMEDGSGRRERIKIEQKKGDGSYDVVSDVEDFYARQIGNERHVKQVIDPDRSALITTWEYYQYGEITGPNGSSAGLGRVKTMTRYDGYKETYYYGINMETTVASYAGDSQGVTTLVAKNPLGKITATSRSVGGNVISQSVEIRGENTVTSRQIVDATNYLQTVTEYYPVGQDVDRKVKKITNPDDTVTIYEYSRVGGTKTTTTYQGVPGGSNITEGTKTVSIVNAQGQEESQITTAVGTGNGIVLSHSVVLSSDAYGRPLSMGHFPDGNDGYAYTTSKTYSCCGVATETDQYGITTTYAYDDLKRVVKTHRLGVTTATVYNGLTVSTHRYTEPLAVAIIPDLSGATAENLISKTVTVPNTEGTKTETWTRSAADSSLVLSSINTTIYLNPASDIPANLPAGVGIRQVVKTADGHTQTTDSYKDGKTYETYGDLSPATRHAYSVNTIGEVTSQSYVDGANLRETTTSQSDRLGRTVSTAKGTNTQTNTYNSLGQLEKSTDADSVSTLYAYNAQGERTTTAIDINGNGEIDFGGTDRITVSTSAPGTYSGFPVMSQTTQVYATNGSNEPTTVSTSHRTPDGLQSWSFSAGVDSPSSSVIDPSNWEETTTNPDGNKTISKYTDGRLASTEYHSSLASSSLLSSVSYDYDSLGRPVTSTDSRTGTTTTAYVSATCDAVRFTTDSGNRVTSYGYDSQGRRITTTLPDNSVTNTSYYPDGQVKATWGSQTYPTFTTYDYAGRQLTLRNQPTLASGVPTNTGGSVTTWNYSTTTGQLLSKLDNAGKGASYTYTLAGRLATRTWGRSSVASPMVTTYTYDSAGLLTTTCYPDDTPDDSDTTPKVTVTYNRLDQPLTITQFKQSRIEYAYDSNLALDTETISYDIDHDGTYEFTRVLDRSNDNLGRSTGYQLKTENSTIEASSAYTRDNAGRLSTVMDAVNTFTYGYQYNQATAADPRVGSATGTKQDFMPYTIAGPVHTVTHNYEAGRNVLLTKENIRNSDLHNLSTIGYTVNPIGQRTKAIRSGTATNSTDWGYDPLGQVVTSDDNTTAEYDRAYQYDTIGNRQRAAAGTLDVNDPTATVYTSNALNQYSSLTVGASGPLAPVYDADGNATAYPLPSAPTSNSTLVWDAENRLISTTVNDTTTTTTYLYDAQSRRIAVTTGGTTTTFIYDGFNCIAEYTGTTLSKTRLWGIDLSGSLQGVGGVGGLLAEKQGSNFYYPLFDGNGNVSEYLAADGSIAAHFEFDPFGNTVVNTDSANLFNYRFSTKPLDFSTGLYYYQYRYYDPLTGRWPSRDPIEEAGGLNLYGFVKNDPLNRVDVLGNKGYLVYRRLAISGLKKFPLTGHVYLAFTEEGANAKQLSEWKRGLRLMGFSNQAVHTFSFHPTSVYIERLKDERLLDKRTPNGNRLGVVNTTGSYVDIDEENYDIKGFNNGADRREIAGTWCEQMRLFNQAILSAVRNNGGLKFYKNPYGSRSPIDFGGNPDPATYSFVSRNCANWAWLIAHRAGLAAPNLSSRIRNSAWNGGVGMGGILDPLGKGVDHIVTNIYNAIQMFSQK